MRTELTNLLPEDRIRSLRKHYFMRLATVTLWLTVLLIVAAGVLLIPVWVYVDGEINSRTEKLSILNASLDSAEDSQVETELKSIGANVAALAAIKNATSPSKVIRDILDIPRTGVTLTGFTFTQAQAGKPGQVAVTGVARSRDALRAYQLSLVGTAFVKSADLPISAYASDTNIGFAITIVLADKP